MPSTRQYLFEEEGRRGGGDTNHRNNERPRSPVQRLDGSTSPADKPFASGFATELPDRGDWVVRGGGHGKVGFVGYAVLWEEMI